jgi:hypothetical protein
MGSCHYYKFQKHHVTIAISFSQKLSFQKYYGPRPKILNNCCWELYVVYMGNFLGPEDDTCTKTIHVRMMDGDSLNLQVIYHGIIIYDSLKSQINFKTCNNHITFHNNI